MYYRYLKSRDNDSMVRYKKIEENICLFGCNEGFIPWLLEKQIPYGQNEPYLWHLDIEKSLAKTKEYLNSTLVIDLKPYQHKDNLSLYEVLNIWGYSSNGWTPILLHLAGLFVDVDPNSVDRNNFQIAESDIDSPIYEVLYIKDGTVKDGKIVGTWNPPPPSSTNGALLWPETLKYFVRCIKERTPDALK
ncbi:MAG: hypothetical protein HY089_02145 [Ignavibacteriales bacterium]|nr:hypothetical protein [Ignavibacteriales bacterium]